MSFSNRRQFLTILGSVGGVAAIDPRRLLARETYRNSEAVSTPSNGSQTFTRTESALGTRVTIAVVHQDSTAANRALDRAFAEIERVEEVMSLYRPHSHVSELNRTGSVTNPHPYLLAVLQQAQRLSRQTQGAFDVTVQPLMDVLSAEPTQDESSFYAIVNHARSKVNWRKLHISRSGVSFGESGMSLTLNGIARGFATDRALDVLHRQGMLYAFVNAGEIGTVGELDATNSPDLSIYVNTRQFCDAVTPHALRNRCLATSSCEYSHSTGSVPTSHVIRTPGADASGSPIVVRVMVLAATAAAADALSTAACAGGLAVGRRIVEATPGTDAFFVLQDGSTFSTPHFPSQLMS